jgi:hypothetical protein
MFAGASPALAKTTGAPWAAENAVTNSAAMVA